MVSTPCLADSVPPARFSGVYSALQDLSLLRLLHLLDAGQVTTVDLRVLLSAREIVNGNDEAPNARIRIIIATVLAIVLGLFPVLWKILKEFSKTVSYRERWTEVRCQGIEMGWLPARRVPGFVGFGERRLKDYMVKIGLSSTMDSNNERNARSRRRRRAQEANEEKGDLEIDVQSLFSVVCVYMFSCLMRCTYSRGPALVTRPGLRSSSKNEMKFWRISRSQRPSTSRASDSPRRIRR